MTVSQIQSSFPTSNGYDIYYDVSFIANNPKPLPIIVFIHGFKGFKDWGHWNLVAQNFAEKGYIFLKINLSHNGVEKHGLDFTRLDLFAKNNFLIELNDIESILNYITDNQLYKSINWDGKTIHLLGHSRGGGLAIIKSFEDERISKCVTWASINNFGYAWTPELIQKWQSEGVIYSENKRTNQLMPMDLQLYTSFVNNQDRLDIKKAVSWMKKPFLAIHGTEDEINFNHALDMKKWNPAIKVELLPAAGHTFGGTHPYLKTTLPIDTTFAIDHTIKFLTK
jgi:pimeloyl-ACP methyl ester carboxylesterase